jgi:hypothetical protein
VPAQGDVVVGRRRDLRVLSASALGFGRRAK